MSKNASKLVSFTGAFLLLAISAVWAQNTCNEREPSFICRSNFTFQNCPLVDGVDTPTGPNEICPLAPAGERMRCGMRCPSSCSLPDDDCLTLGTVCRARGYLANPNNCREYFVCNLIGETFRRVNYVCAGFFDDAVKKCSNLVEVCEERPLLTV